MTAGSRTRLFFQEMPSPRGAVPSSLPQSSLSWLSFSYNSESCRLLCSSGATYQGSRGNWEEAKYRLSPVPCEDGGSVRPICGPKRKEYEQGMAPVKLSWGYFGCGLSPVSESAGISAALWGARWSPETAGQRITAILYHQMTLQGELVKAEIHILSLKLTRTIVWYQSSCNSRRNSIVYLSCLLFPFTSSFLLECKEKWKLLTENQMTKLL